MPKALTSFLFAPLPLAIFGCLISLTAVAQITPDGTTSTIVNQNGNDEFTIEQGSQIGDNLFHSFSEFSVPKMGSATFNNAVDIANIFSRVTGNNISNIKGLLSANGAANLFLINPNGIIFSENASLDIGGSFFASTADSLLFEGNAEFSASNPTVPPLLEVSIPIGINFRDNPGDIINQAMDNGLEVKPGKNITLVGGNINFESGTVNSRGGNIFLGGLSAAGTIEMNNDGSLNFPQNVTQADITLSNSEIANKTENESNAGNLTIRAESVKITDSFIITEPLNVGEGGSITIDVINSGTFNLSNSFINTSSIGEGNAGNIIIRAGSVKITDFSFVITDPLGAGNAGSITIDVANDGTFNLSNSFISTETLDQGNGGNIIIRAGLVDITDSSSIITETSGVGNAGSITIDVKNGGTFNLSGNSEISSSTVGQGNGGNISISSGVVEITNSSTIFSDTVRTGKGGDINISADSVKITDLSGITASTFGEGNVENDEGNAGNITISAGLVTINDSSFIIAETLGTGDAGDIKIDLPDDKTFSLSSGLIVTDTFTAGDAGDVIINTGTLTLTDIGIVSADGIVEGGNAGLVKIDADDDIILDNVSLIFSQPNDNPLVFDIVVNAEFIIAFPNGNNDIASRNERGLGGNIIITAFSIFGIEERPLSDETNDIDARFVSVNTPEVDPTSGLVELPEKLGDATDQISQNICEQGAGSEFIITGKGGLPPNPHETLNSDEEQIGLVEPVLLRQGEEIRIEKNDTSTEKSTSELVPAQGWIFNDNGEVTLTSYKTDNTEIRKSQPKNIPNCFNGI